MNFTQGMKDVNRKLISKVSEIIEGPLPRDDKLFAVCELINVGVPNCDWVGFYLIDPFKENELVLGPFVGETTEHMRIPVGSGICGMAAQRKDTVVVDDVSKETNYLSCSPNVKSEIVVPILKDGKVVAELDIDSHRVAAFSGENRELFEKVCKILSDIF